MTRKQKVQSESKNIPKNVLEHLFVLLNISGNFYESLYKMIGNSRFVVKKALEYYSKSKMDNESAEEY